MSFIILISSVTSKISSFHNLMINYPSDLQRSSTPVIRNQCCLFYLHSRRSQSLHLRVSSSVSPYTHSQRQLRTFLYNPKNVSHRVPSCITGARRCQLSYFELQTPTNKLSCVTSASRTPACARARGTLLCHLFQECQGQCSVLKLSR